MKRMTFVVERIVPCGAPAVGAYEGCADRSNE